MGEGKHLYFKQCSCSHMLRVVDVGAFSEAFFSSQRLPGSTGVQEIKISIELRSNADVDTRLVRGEQQEPSGWMGSGEANLVGGWALSVSSPSQSLGSETWSPKDFPMNSVGI